MIDVNGRTSFIPLLYRDTDGMGGGGEPEFAEPAAGSFEIQSGSGLDQDAEGWGTSEESPELAEPEPRSSSQTGSQRTGADIAFAEMRRNNELLARQLQERDSVLGSIFEGEDPLLTARAYAEGMSEEELMEAEWVRQEARQRDQELEELRQFKAQNTFKEDLSAIREAYPDLTAQSVEDLGVDFLQIMATGSIDPVTAYEIVRSKAQRAARIAPPEVGRVNQHSAAEKEYFTVEEVRRMSPEQVHKNWDRINKSRARWR